MGRTTVVICDCGCGNKVGPEGFELSQVGMSLKFRGLKLERNLTFVDFDHLSNWLDITLPIVKQLEKDAKNAPQNHGMLSDPALNSLYID